MSMEATLKQNTNADEMANSSQGETDDVETTTRVKERSVKCRLIHRRGNRWQSHDFVGGICSEWTGRRSANQQLWGSSTS